MYYSEFLAEENPLYFWQFLEELRMRTSYVEFISNDVDALGALAVSVAESIAPGSKNVRLLNVLGWFLLDKERHIE